MKTKKEAGGLTMMKVMGQFSTEEKARLYFEKLRWPHGPVCAHCGNADKKLIWKRTPNKETKVRPGLYKCAACGEDFTCTMNTVMEDSHVPLNKWLIATYMMMASKTQISALQIQRHLELGSYQTAWFLCQRIRFALRDVMPTGQLSGTVESDETLVGGRVKGHRRYLKNKTTVVSLVERGGRVRSTVYDKVSGRALTRLLRQHVAPTSNLNTDESNLYDKAGKHFASHDRVNHGAEEYGRRDRATGRHATTNTIEGFFGNTKRSLDGTHHHVSRKYLPLYMSEIDFKYNLRKDSDGTRTDAGIRLMEGKRLMLRPPKRNPSAQKKS